jgi:hypothetical protein
MPRLLIFGGMILGSAAVGTVAGGFIGCRLAEARIREVPPGVGHGPAYVAIGDFAQGVIFGMLAGTAVGIGLCLGRVLKGAVDGPRATRSGETEIPPEDASPESGGVPRPPISH